MSEPLNTGAHALRPVRIIGDSLREYEAVTFPDNPYQGCELYLRRCHAFGYLKDDGSNCLIDILDKGGDIIQDYPITRDGFDYLRRTLKFRRCDL